MQPARRVSCAKLTQLVRGTWPTDMYRVLITCLLLGLVSPSAEARQTNFGVSPSPKELIGGSALVIDGDTIDIRGQRIRLEGVDAPERSQRCVRGSVAWSCGSEAAHQLRKWIANRPIQCIPTGKDRNGRTLATCYLAGVDIGAWLVATGWALAFVRYSDRYLPQESIARSARRGVWAGGFAAPWEWRRCRSKGLLGGSCEAPSLSAPTATQTPSSTPLTKSTQAIRYSNCKQARLAGAAPLRRGQPGYSLRLDGDQDGVACE